MKKAGLIVSDENRRFLGSACDALPDHKQSSWLGEGLLLQSWALYELEENCYENLRLWANLGLYPLSDISAVSTVDQCC